MQKTSWPDGADIPDLRTLQTEARLRAMVDEHLAFIKRVLRNNGVQSADVDDLVQGTFITAARRLDDIRVGSEKAFLLRTALYLTSHLRRTFARRRELNGDVPDLGTWTSTPEDLTNLSQLRRLLDRVLDQMDGNLRRVFVLFELEELSAGEIASVLGIAPGTVASRLRRARSAFRIVANRLWRSDANGSGQRRPRALSF